MKPRTLLPGAFTLYVMHTTPAKKDYLEDYIQKLCAQTSLAPDKKTGKLFCKAAGEFTLLCYVLKSISSLPPSYQTTCRLLANILCRQEVNYCTFTPGCALEFLGFHDWKDRLTSFAGRVDRQQLPMETAFILENFKNDPLVWYWEAATWEICKKATENGLDNKSFYIITHVIMFATCMGSRKVHDVFSAKSIEVLHTMLTLMQSSAHNNKNWDLLLEVFICRMYMSPGNSHLWHQLNTAVSCMPCYRGLTLTYGADMAEFGERLPGAGLPDAARIDIQLQEPYQHAPYYLFHTNLVKKLFYLTCPDEICIMH